MIVVIIGNYVKAAVDFKSKCGNFEMKVDDNIEVRCLVGSLKLLYYLQVLSVIGNSIMGKNLITNCNGFFPIKKSKFFKKLYWF